MNILFGMLSRPVANSGPKKPPVSSQSPEQETGLRTPANATGSSLSIGQNRRFHSTARVNSQEKALVAAEALLELSGDANLSALFGAVKAVSPYHPESIQSCQSLLAHPDVDFEKPVLNPLGAKLLCLAIERRNITAFQLILSSPKLSRRVLSFTDETGENLLVKLQKSRLSHWSALLKQHPYFNINYPSVPGETALVRAASAGNMAAVKFYLKVPELDLLTANQEVQALYLSQINGHFQLYNFLKETFGLYSMADIQSFSLLEEEAKAQGITVDRYIKQKKRQAPHQSHVMEQSLSRLSRGGYFHSTKS